jgi:hypothetical protein
MAAVQPEPWLRALITTTTKNSSFFLKFKSTFLVILLPQSWILFYLYVFHHLLSSYTNS